MKFSSKKIIFILILYTEYSSNKAYIINYPYGSYMGLNRILDPFTGTFDLIDKFALVFLDQIID